MFEGEFEWKQYHVSIKHSRHYYHSMSKTIDILNEEETYAADKEYDLFDRIYQSICKKLENIGYQWIEDEGSEAHFIDECNDNEWTFEKDGTMRNI